MKKAQKILLSAIFLTIALNANAFDQKRFDEDTQFYNFAKGKAKGITILLSPFNTDHAVKEAFDLYAQGDVSKWKTMVTRLKEANQKADDIRKVGGTFNYFSDCANAVNYADLLWNYGSNMRNHPEEWGNQQSFNYQQYQVAKSDLEKSLTVCKTQINNPPNKKDYERELVTFGLSS